MIVEFKCLKCDYVFEEIRKYSELTKPIHCPQCQNHQPQTIVRLLSKVAPAQFIGTGFYENDYKKKS